MFNFTRELILDNKNKSVFGNTFTTRNIKITHDTSNRKEKIEIELLLPYDLNCSRHSRQELLSVSYYQ